MPEPEIFGAMRLGHEALIDLVKQCLANRQRKTRARVAVGLGGEGAACQMAHLAAGDVAAKDLLHEQGNRGGGIEFPIAPGVVAFATDPFDEFLIEKLKGVVLDPLQRRSDTGHPWPPV